MNDISSNNMSMKLRLIIRNINDLIRIEYNDLNLDEFTREELYIIIETYRYVANYNIGYIENNL
jgi:hypothetical protein